MALFALFSGESINIDLIARVRWVPNETSPDKPSAATVYLSGLSEPESRKGESPASRSIITLKDDEAEKLWEILHPKTAFSGKPKAAFDYY